MRRADGVVGRPTRGGRGDEVRSDGVGRPDRQGVEGRLGRRDPPNGSEGRSPCQQCGMDKRTLPPLSVSVCAHRSRNEVRVKRTNAAPSEEGLVDAVSGQRAQAFAVSGGGGRESKGNAPRESGSARSDRRCDVIARFVFWRARGACAAACARRCSSAGSCSHRAMLRAIDAREGTNAFGLRVAPTPLALSPVRRSRGGGRGRIGSSQWSNRGRGSQALTSTFKNAFRSGGRA